MFHLVLVLPVRKETHKLKINIVITAFASPSKVLVDAHVDAPLNLVTRMHGTQNAVIYN